MPRSGKCAVLVALATAACGGSGSAALPKLTSGVEAIAAGGDSTCALVSGGVECWGFNYYGQLGNDSTDLSTVPVQVTLLTSGVAEIAVGGEHACALVSGGVECWGDNDHGQLGLGPGTAADGFAPIQGGVPVQSPALTQDVVAIAAGELHTCALQNSPSSPGNVGVQCWGDNEFGQIGSPDTTLSPVPLQVASLTTGVTAIAAGGGHTCAIVGQGVECWGNNDFGQLGTAATTLSPVPLEVASLSTGVTAIAAGASHTCAVVNGGVQCWGDNSHGQLGDGTTVGSASPVPVAGIATGATGVAAGAFHTCALVSGGVECWGYDYYGQLGNNAGVDSSVPIQVQ